MYFYSFVQEIIQGAKGKHRNKPDAIIGVHGRFTDYSGHLKLRGAKLAGKNFYAKSIQYFRNRYKNPIFLVTTDDPGRAQAMILRSVMDTRYTNY